MSEPETPRTSLAQSVSGGRVDVAAAIGGRRGLVESIVPSLVFVLTFTITQELAWSVWGAIGVAVALAVVRVVQRQSLQQALGGLVGVAIAAFFAARSGQAVDFYLPSLLKNIGYAAAYLVSILVRWPLLGILVGPLTGEGMAWRRDPARLRAYSQASWAWVAMFLLRVAVQYPLYQAQALGALGFASVVLGLPLFGLTIYVSWVILRRVPPATAAGTRPAGAPPAEATAAPEQLPDARA